MERFYVNFLALALGYALDLVCGDPRCLPHPVRFIGKATVCLERMLRIFFKGGRAEKFAGALIVLLLAGGGSLLVFMLVNLTFNQYFLWGLAIRTYLFYVVLAVGDMVRHITDVVNALQEKNLKLARERVGLLVSRDTHNLDGEGVARAALESLFENTADGVVAPLFYIALGGPVLAVFYKAVNTLDSMLGYKTPQYYYLGWAAARTDDLLSFLPARLTALIFILLGKLSGLDWKQGWWMLLRDRKKHESPNSAWPEAAAAWVLGVRLGGIDLYQGREKVRSVINETGRPPRYDDLTAALLLFKKAAHFAFGLALLITFIKQLIAGVLC